MTKADFTGPRYVEDYEVSSLKVRRLQEAAAMARKRPGTWVEAERYKTNSTARSVAHRLKKTMKDLTVISRGASIFFLCPEVETKES